MITLYAVALSIGLLGLGWWIIAERRRGGSSGAVTIRRAITAVVAFGMGGLSASFGGIAPAFAFGAAVAAAVALVIYGDRVSG